MTTQPSKNAAPKLARPPTRPSRPARWGLLGILLLPFVLLAAAVSPKQTRELAAAESID
ncbi:hypothetical protein HNQ07_002910 [Deinococcus metalli]|uniref:Uncharacterized protein n=1 Tax=Deinococcus metalli TaxID=1141878 RepID=A0A7W8NRZ3_9DEIO|nr:hypothetical protein [Deinococcus metalli]MBB5377418.1 hypothetical protein [Deinococcus metalli]GHF50263.1 hypothetical protein GCM10017781_28460 [Deinococcus metalli]